ncbi:MAG: class I SAM-dependent methyltransferase [Coleofasciculus sp. G3-WIS-01]|uniref:methyltransferase domain-containing protein n=1 Tax=Coleofasciculus sp. G3-WIS-01 TaxID=3069528 RepID=UPI0032F1EAF7
MEYCTWEEAVRWLLAQPDQQKIVRDCYYDRPLKSTAARYWQSPEWQAIRAFFPMQEGYALDLGAGNGIASYSLAKDGWQVKALEPDQSNLVGCGAIKQLAEEAKLAIEVIQGIGENLPFNDRTFNLVFARQALHHAQDLRELSQEIYRVLKPGGVLVAVREHVISYQRDLPKFLDAHPLHHLYGGENAYLLNEYLGAMTLAGLQIEKVIGSFDSVINYAPLTETSLKEELKKRFNRILGGKIASQLLLSDHIFPQFLHLLSKIDQRPGRLFSFICHKMED